MATVVIKVNLVDLTDIIIFSDAHFDSRVNGEPGPCEFRARDDDNNLVFESGQSITVDIDAERVWTGYLMQATSTYIFPAGPLPPDVPRIWRITGVDINILFRRRIVVDPDDPTVMTGKTYKYTGTPTPDTTAIASLVTDFLDLTDDALDVSTFVENVGDINVDQDVNAFAGSWTWEQAMTSIASLPAAIYYLAAGRDLVYTDVDTPNAPFRLTDMPVVAGGSSAYDEDFNRTVPSGWGTGPIGTWTTDSGTASVSSGQGSLVTGGGSFASQVVPLPPETLTATSIHLRMAITWPSVSDPDMLFEFDVYDGGAFTYDVGAFVDEAGELDIYWSSPTGSDSAFVSTGFTPAASEIWLIDMLWEGSDLQAKAWPQAQTEPAYQVSLTNVDFTLADITGTPSIFVFVDSDASGRTWIVDGGDGGLGVVAEITGEVGYREPELLKDASNLINDFLAWGAGTGSNEPVFKRLIDDDSVTAHGRWQQANLTYDVYKQATVDRIADSWINGSPQSRRGHKDDKIAFMCTVFEPGLQAGMKVDVTSNVFEFNDVLPIRELRLSFATQSDPIYRLTLSHAIDTPWSFYQMFNPSMPRLAWDDLFVLIEPGVPGCPPLCETPIYQSGSDDYILAHAYVGGSLEVMIDDVPVVVTESDPGSGVFEYETGDQSAGMVACYVVPTPGDPEDPCYCVDSIPSFVIDNFSRTEVSDWGTATGPDYNITIPAGDWVKDAVSVELGPSTESVNGDYGVVDYLGPPFEPGAASTITDMFLPMPVSWVSGRDWIECRWQVKTTVTGPLWYLYDIPGQQSIFFSVSFLAGLSLIYGRGQSGGIDFQFSQTGLDVVNIDNIPFWGALRLEAGVLQFKAWLDGDAEPIDWEINPLSGVALEVGAITHAICRSRQDFQAESPNSSSTGHIVMRVPTCVDVFAAPDEFDGVLETDGTDTIDLGGPFWKGTSRVWLDGEAQELGVDYTEDSDEGLIIFTSTPASGLTVVVTRVRKTPLGGGASRRLI